MEGAALMVLYLLNQGEQASLPAGPLLIRLQGRNADLPRLMASGSAGTPLTAPRAFARPGGLLLPRIEEPTTITLLPPGSLELFPPQSIAIVAIGPDGGDPEADHVQLTFDVSGLPLADLALLKPAGSYIGVAARGPRQEPPLPPTAQLARDVARELLGLAYVSSENAVDVVVGVDCSPSMRPWLEAGVLEAVLEIFSGLASVIDPNGRVDAVLCGRKATKLPAETIDVFASTVTAEAKRYPLVTGLRSATLPAGTSATVTYLVTDGLPPDLDAQQNCPHLAIVGDASAGSPEHRQSRAPMTPVFADRRPRDGVRWDRPEMRSIVASLLTAYERRDGESA